VQHCYFEELSIVETEVVLGQEGIIVKG